MTTLYQINLDSDFCVHVSVGPGTRKSLFQYKFTRVDCSIGINRLQYNNNKDWRKCFRFNPTTLFSYYT